MVFRDPTEFLAGVSKEVHHGHAVSQCIQPLQKHLHPFLHPSFSSCKNLNNTSNKLLKLLADLIRMSNGSDPTVFCPASV